MHCLNVSWISCSRLCRHWFLCSHHNFKPHVPHELLYFKVAYVHTSGSEAAIIIAFQYIRSVVPNFGVDHHKYKSMSKKKKKKHTHIQNNASPITTVASNHFNSEMITEHQGR